jgi:hypothetical protein
MVKSAVEVVLPVKQGLKRGVETKPLFKKRTGVNHKLQTIGIEKTGLAK